MELQTRLYQLKESDRGVSLLNIRDRQYGLQEVLNSKAFLQGESLFSSLYVERQKPWFLEDHLGRLLSSLRWFFAYSLEQEQNLLEALKLELETLQFKHDHSYLRLTIFESSNNRYLVVTSKAHANPRAELRSLRLKSVTQASTVNARHQHKWGNYLESNLLKRQLDLDEDLLFLNAQSCVLELTTSNIFFCDGKDFFTPTLSEELLAGVYRQNLITFLKASGKNVKEQDIKINDLHDFKFAFATNCLSGIREVCSIDQHIFSSDSRDLLINLKKELY